MAVTTKLEALRELALDHHGYVTSQQALRHGVTYADLSTMVARGRLDRLAHGVYRVPQVAETEYDPFHLAILWTGAPEACLSHDTALACWGISDINPTHIHVTLDTGRRIRRRGGQGYVLHYERLDPRRVTWWQGMRIVDVGTAIRQGIDAGVPTYLLRQAIDRAGRTSRLPQADRDLLTRRLDDRG